MARAVNWAPSRALGVRVTVTKPPASSTAMAPTGAAGPIAGRHTSLTALAARCCAPAGIVPGASSARRLGAYFRFDTDVCGLRTRRRRSGSFYVHICSRSRFAQAHNRFTQGINCRNHIDTIHIHTCVVLTFTQEYELKVYTPYNQTVALGLGSERNGGGAPSTAEGHTHAFGCTEEKLVLGLKQVGSRNDAPYDRVTGAGFVAAHNGQYADALSKVPSPYSSPKPPARSQPRS
eukprot:jgi/Chrpa1/7425/Chrysochromulina_OHIO_Genome00010866-RA